MSYLEHFDAFENMCFFSHVKKVKQFIVWGFTHMISQDIEIKEKYF